MDCFRVQVVRLQRWLDERCRTEDVRTHSADALLRTNFKVGWKVCIEEEAERKEKRTLMEKQVAWMIYEYFKVSDANESVMDLKANFRRPN